MIDKLYSKIDVSINHDRHCLISACQQYQCVNLFAYIISAICFVDVLYNKLFYAYGAE